jgi:N-acetylglucosamine-6-phosphate deacetylase
VEMIADGKHLPPTLMRLAYRAIGPERLCLISDATNGAGLPDGSRVRLAGLDMEVVDGVCMLLDRSAFAGSATLLDRMLGVVTGVDVGFPVVDAVRMASATPARVAGVSDRKGRIAPGHDADLAVFDDGFRTWRTMIAGRWVHRAREETA